VKPQCRVCGAIEAGEMEIEENEHSLETEQSPTMRLRIILKKQQRISEERGEKLAEVENKNQELLKNLEHIEAAKLLVDEKLAKMANNTQELEELRAAQKVANEKLAQAQELRESYEELKIAKLVNENKLLEVEYKNKELTKSLEDLKAAKSVTIQLVFLLS